MCPSTSVANATVFLGMITPRGRVAYVTPEVPMTPEDVAALPSTPGRAQEAQYRLAGPCVESGCGHWSGRHCKLGEELAGLSSDVPDEAGLPKCAIRPRCRWFGDQGPAACKVCSYVVTDLRTPAGRA